MKIQSLILKAISDIKKNGFLNFLQKTRFYYFGKGKFLWVLNLDDWKRKKIKSKDFFKRYEVNLKVKKKKELIVFILPGVWSSGGMAVLVRHANMLKKKGYSVVLVTQDLKIKIDWFENQKVLIAPMNRIWDLLEYGIDILIATGWNSAPTVDLLPAKRKLYFVQLDERRFYERDDLKELVGETYKLPFEFIVIAKWMKKWLKNEFNQESYYVPNGLDVDIFKPVAPIEKKSEKLRILIEGPIGVPFKGVAEAYSVACDFDAEIWMVSGRGKLKSNWKVDRFFEKVPHNQMPKIYSSCDILLKMSWVESFCYPPLEMMACGGVPVILKVSGIEEYARNEENCLIVENADEAREAVQRLINDKELYDKLKQNGLETAKNWSWERSNEEFEKIISKK